MAPLKKILVGTDFSPAAVRALERAARLAHEHQAKLEIVHATTALPARAAARLGLRPEIVAQAKAHAEANLEAAREAARRAGVVAQTRLRAGAATAVLLDAAVKRRADLVVLGQRGERSIRDAVIGTTAERFIDRAADLDTLLVTKKARASTGRVLACVALGPLSHQIITSALTLFPQAKLTVLHVYEPPYELKLQSIGVPEELIREHRDSTLRDAQARLAAAIAAVDVDASRVAVILRRGHPQRVIGNLAKGYDVVVIGRHPSATAEVFLGSVAKHVLRLAASDVLVSRRPGAHDSTHVHPVGPARGA